MLEEKLFERPATRGSPNKTLDPLNTQASQKNYSSVGRRAINQVRSTRLDSGNVSNLKETETRVSNDVRISDKKKRKSTERTENQSKKRKSFSQAAASSNNGFQRQDSEFSETMGQQTATEENVTRKNKQKRKASKQNRKCK